MTYVGIDVSKATFVVAYSSAKGSETKTFKNTVKGILESLSRPYLQKRTIVYWKQQATTVCYLFICSPRQVLLSVWRIL